MALWATKGDEDASTASDREWGSPSGCAGLSGRRAGSPLQGTALPH